jgi:hypothetical protein
MYFKNKNAKNKEATKLKNYYWQQGNEWDDNPKPEEETDVNNLRMIGEYRVCTFCDEVNCSDYIPVSGYLDSDYYCKYKQCKFENYSQFEVNKHYKTSALYGGTLLIRVVARTNDTITYVFADDSEKQYTKNIIMQNNIESIEAWEYHEHKCYWYAKTE